MRPIQIEINVQLNTKTITLRVCNSDTVKEVKAMINDKKHIPAEQQILTFDGMILQDECRLYECKLSDMSTVHLHILGVTIEMPSSICELWAALNKSLSNHQKCRQTNQKGLQYNIRLLKRQEQQDKEMLQNQINCIEKKGKQELETLSADFKLQLYIEKEQAEKLKQELNAEKANAQMLRQRCDYLENTVISTLLYRKGEGTRDKCRKVTDYLTS